MNKNFNRILPSKSEVFCLEVLWKEQRTLKWYH